MTKKSTALLSIRGLASQTTEESSLSPLSTAAAFNPGSDEYVEVEMTSGGETEKDEAKSNDDFVIKVISGRGTHLEIG